MRVYNSDTGSNHNIQILKHLSLTPIAAAGRIEGMFAHQENCSLKPDFSVDVFDRLGNVINTKSLKQYIEEFCCHASKFSISEYLLDVNRPLRLIDLWEDDPIGSGGPKVIDSDQLSLSEKLEVRALFDPFTDVIYPPHIFNVMSKNDIKGIMKGYTNNRLFTEEYRKRKARSKAINEDFKEAKYQEIVWLDYTLKLKQWALDRGYDSFVYSNIKEGSGEDTYVTLLPNQLSKINNSLFFNEEKYLTEMPPVIKSIITRLHSKPIVTNRTHEFVYSILWGQKDPMPFWE
ncbi:hypothetical protein Sps_03439 [Shewanella psychrophila]|uniref:Uncharacterized protein n=1 Tax=Shewanella psychrophila TaxID=225848 RepID=A0A1S6HSQ3_9GAMM|nr:hypothetical protein [Shewanella psychrophila]AQS38566.1 hypothetical protein Sps_03439 [Shewanella psychrophila]